MTKTQPANCCPPAPLPKRLRAMTPDDWTEVYNCFDCCCKQCSDHFMSEKPGPSRHNRWVDAMFDSEDAVHLHRLNRRRLEKMADAVMLKRMALQGGDYNDTPLEHLKPRSLVGKWVRQMVSIELKLRALIADSEIYQASCAKCGTPLSRLDYKCGRILEDDGEGSERGRTFTYCSGHCLEAH